MKAAVVVKTFFLLKAYCSACIAQAKIGGWQSFSLPFLLLMSSVLEQILLLYCSSGQKNFKMKYIECGPYFYFILCVYFIQADYSTSKLFENISGKKESINS